MLSVEAYRLMRYDALREITERLLADVPDAGMITIEVSAWEEKDDDAEDRDERYHYSIR